MEEGWECNCRRKSSVSREMKVESETVSRQRKDQSERVRSIIAEANDYLPPPGAAAMEESSGCNWRSKSSVSSETKVESERARSIIAEANPTHLPLELHQGKRARSVIAEANRR